MSVAADATVQSISNENDMNVNSAKRPSSTDKKSHIHEHPFMKEVKYF